MQDITTIGIDLAKEVFAVVNKQETLLAYEWDAKLRLLLGPHAR